MHSSIEDLNLNPILEFASSWNYRKNSKELRFFLEEGGFSLGVEARWSDRLTVVVRFEAEGDYSESISVDSDPQNLRSEILKAMGELILGYSAHLKAKSAKILARAERIENLTR